MKKNLRFLSKQEALQELQPIFFQVNEDGKTTAWDGVETPYTSSRGELIVFVPVETIQRCQWSLDENRQYLEDGEPDLSHYQVDGFHVNVYLNESTTELDAFEIQVNNPANVIA